MYELPTSIISNGTEYKIRHRGDYRVVLDCFGALDDMELTPPERLYAGLIIFYEDFSSIEDVNAVDDIADLIDKMFDFFNIGEIPDPREKDKPKLVDWQADSNLIISAINNVAGKEVRAEEYLHWWTFIGYYMAIGDSSLSTVISIRSKIAKGKKLENYEKEFKADNPRYFAVDLRTHEQKENDEWVMSVWNNGG